MFRVCIPRYLDSSAGQSCREFFQRNNNMRPHEVLSGACAYNIFFAFVYGATTTLHTTVVCSVNYYGTAIRDYHVNRLTPIKIVNWPNGGARWRPSNKPRDGHRHLWFDTPATTLCTSTPFLRRRFFVRSPIVYDGHSAVAQFNRNKCNIIMIFVRDLAVQLARLWRNN